MVESPLGDSARLRVGPPPLFDQIPAPAVRIEAGVDSGPGTDHPEQLTQNRLDPLEEEDTVAKDRIERAVRVRQRLQRRPPNSDVLNPHHLRDPSQDRQPFGVEIHRLHPVEPPRQRDGPLARSTPGIKDLASGKHDPVQPVEIVGQPESIFGLNELSFIVGLLQSDYLLKRRKPHLALIMLRNRL